MQLYSYLINVFGFMYVLFRVYVVRMITTERYTPFASVIPKADIALMFLAIIALVYILKRNVVWAAIYLAAYFAYFGYCLSLSLPAGDNLNSLMYIVGIVLALLNFLDVVVNKNRTSTKGNKTDWFYGNEKYTRELDERADKNQYKIR